MKRRIIVFFVILISIIFITACEPTDEINAKYLELESILLPKTSQGNIDFDAMEIKDHQHVAYCLNAEARLRKNSETIIELTQYLVNHSDDNLDGEIGWGLGFPWDAFDDNSVNPSWHVYAIETVNVMDAYIEALNTGYLSEELSEKVKKQLYDTVIIWNKKYYSKSSPSGEKYFYWYSISKNDEVGTINIDAKMVGTQAKLLNQYGYLFTEKEKEVIYYNIDHTYSKIIQKSYIDDGVIVWDYIEKQENDPNDVIHHGFILEGIYDYQKYRTNNPIKYNKEYSAFINKCINDDMIYSTPDYSSYRCFNTGAIRWVDDKNMQKSILLKSYDVYLNSDTDKRQLSFLFDALSIFLSKE